MAGNALGLEPVLGIVHQALGTAEVKRGLPVGKMLGKDRGIDATVMQQSFERFLAVQTTAQAMHHLKALGVFILKAVQGLAKDDFFGTAASVEQ